MIEEGSLPLAFGAAVVFLGALLFETNVLLRWRRDLYFLASIPITRRLVPIPHPPRGTGRTSTVRWEVSSPHLVRFWADPGERTTLSGLHGVVVLAVGRQGVELDVRWAPPWSPMIAALWVAGLGVVRGEGALTIPIAVGMVVALLFVYGERAHRVAAELRWSFLQGEGDPHDRADEPDAL